jgi:cell division protein FtsX
MKSLLIFLVVLALLVVAVGFYQGWFNMTGTTNDSGSKSNLNLEIDSDKVRQDVDAVKAKANEVTEGVKRDLD